MSTVLRMFLLVFILHTLLPWAAMADVEGEPCGAEPTDDFIEFGDMVLCSIATIGDADFFRFSASSGEKVYLSITNRRSLGSGALQARIFRPNGTTFATYSQGQITRTPIIDQTGEWTIQVNEQNNDDLFDYALVLERIVPPSPGALELQPSRPLLDRMIAPAGDADLYVFEGLAGTTVAVRSVIQAPDPFTLTCIRVFQPDGTPVGAAATCSTTTANLVIQVQQSGAHAVVATEFTNQREVVHDMELLCIQGNCPLIDRPGCQIELSNTVYFDGDFLTVDSWRLKNPGPNPLAVEIKSWITVPGGATASLFSVGSDGSLVLAAGFDVELGPFNLFEVTSAFPRGSYSLDCRFLEPTTGETIQLDVNPFVLQ